MHSHICTYYINFDFLPSPATPRTLFRGNSLASKSFDQFMKVLYVHTYTLSNNYIHIQMYVLGLVLCAHIPSLAIRPVYYLEDVRVLFYMQCS